MNKHEKQNFIQQIDEGFTRTESSDLAIAKRFVLPCFKTSEFSKNVHVNDSSVNYAYSLISFNVPGKMSVTRQTYESRRTNSRKQ